MTAELLTELFNSGLGSNLLLASPEKKITLDQFEKQCDGLEKMLRRENIDMLALHAENSPSWVVADIVAQRMNICLVPLPTFFSPLQLRAVIKQCGARFLLTDNAEPLLPLLEKPHLSHDPETELQLCLLDKESTGPVEYPPETGKITFTSGSTGTPKGVCLSNQQLLIQAQTLVETVSLNAPRHLCLLPLSTLLENVAGVYAPLLAGGEVLLPTLKELGYQGSRLVEPGKILKQIQDAAPDTLILIPELLKLLVSAAKSGWQIPASLKFIAVGGSKVGVTLLQEAWSLGFPVYEGYGLSECTSVVSLNTQEEHMNGTCGKPLANVSVQEVDGELRVSGNTMLGYLNETDTWYQDSFATGDIGHLDDDGFVHLEGRNKNILISSYGRNISPEWPESELLAHAMLQDVIVIGDARPYCVALISCRNPELQNILVQQWVDQVNDSLPDYARIRDWHRLKHPLGHYPGLLTANGRLCREAIAKQFDSEIAALYVNQQSTVASVAGSPA